ncbi:hypothetical protein FKM82_004133 [Ascaphus truei]
MRLSLKAFAFSLREKMLPKNGKEEIYHIIWLSTVLPWGFQRLNGFFPPAIIFYSTNKNSSNNMESVTAANKTWKITIQDSIVRGAIHCTMGSKSTHSWHV